MAHSTGTSGAAVEEQSAQHHDAVRAAQSNAGHRVVCNPRACHRQPGRVKGLEDTTKIALTMF